jgi:hypothetical protein
MTEEATNLSTTEDGRSPAKQGRATHEPSQSALSPPSVGIPNADDMIERVARALFDREWELSVPPVRDEVWLDEEQRRYFRESAEAAICAMREPTDAMISAAAETPGMEAANSAMTLHQARGYGFKAGSFDAGSPLHQAWRAMIDAAQGTEARRAETENTGSVHDGPVGNADAPNPSPPSPPSGISREDEG